MLARTTAVVLQGRPKNQAETSIQRIAAVPILSELALGEAGRIQRIEGADAVSLRLLEMGLTPGAAVRLVGCAPLGDPLELEIRGYRLSVRKAEAGRVILAEGSLAPGK